MGRWSTIPIVLSCEHATSHVPVDYRYLFASDTNVLQTHRGWDPGTKELGVALRCKLKAPLFQTQVSRLLVEVNRSPHHPRLFSEFSQRLTDDQRRELIARYYEPHRAAVTQAIAERLAPQRPVLHLSLHSFTPVWEGVERTAEVAWLYDPSRSREKQFCQDWLNELQLLEPEWRLRRNYPYQGRSDGFTTALRRQWNDRRYLGIELEVNQNLMREGLRKRTVRQLVVSLERLLRS